MVQPLAAQEIVTQQVVPAVDDKVSSPMSSGKEPTTVPMLKICNVFSGPIRDDGMQVYAKIANANACLVSFDTEIDDEHDMADEFAWKQLYHDLESDVYDGSGWAPPCSTFAAARGSHPGETWGPQPLRTAAGPERYGLRTLKASDKDTVRLGTLLAVRTAAALKLCLKKRIPFFYETPLPKDGKVSMTLLDEFSEIICHPEVVYWRINQCRWGASTTKPTLLLTFLLDHEPTPVLCNHDKKWWIIPSTGVTYFQPHPPLRGKEWAIEYHMWDASVYYPPPPHGADWLTRSSAAYPAEMNEMLANLLTKAAGVRQASRLDKDDDMPFLIDDEEAIVEPKHKMMRVGKWNNTLVRVNDVQTKGRSGFTSGSSSKLEFSAPLRGSAVTDNKANAELLAVGGLRRCSKSVDKIPGLQDIGTIVYDKLAEFLQENPEVVQRAINSIGTTDDSAKPWASDVESVRDILRSTLNVKGTGASESSEVFGGIMEAWRVAAMDPDYAVCSWFDSGAPAGILVDIPSCGIFPEHPIEEYDDPCDLATDFDTFTNHDASDEDDLAFTEFERITDKGWALKFNTLQEVTEYLGSEPVLSKVGIISKIKGNEVKKRLVVDSKQAGITAATKRFQRALLPRTLDVVWDTLDVLEHTCSDDQDSDVEYLVLDFSDAFFHVPNDKRERKYSVMKYRGVFYVLLRTAQGTRGAPLTWGRVAALVGRLTQGMLGTRAARVNIYVDDPILVLGGRLQERELMMAMTMLVWCALGFNLSFKKGKRGRCVQWVSATYSIWDDFAGVTVSIKPEIEAEVMKMTSEIMSANVVPVKTLRSYAGKVSHIASVLATWRPFLQEIWGALKDSSTSKAPNNCIWVKQCRAALKWFDAFFRGIVGATTREYPLYIHLGQGESVEINLDASPWGLGGYVEHNRIITHYFISEVITIEASLLGQDIGEASSQQTFEALAALVALRAWSHLWKAQRCVIKVRSDSISALVVVLRLKTCGKGPGIVAREMALDVAESLYRPDVVEHVPGIANKVCDMLSRKFQPGAKFSMPSALKHANETVVAVRNKAYYRSL